MRFVLSFFLLTFITTCSGDALTNHKGESQPAPFKVEAAMAEVTQQIKNFIEVEGASLRDRLANALRQGRSKSAPFWTAYSFDVRPGIGIDAEINHFNGSMNTFSDTNVVIGTSNGRAIETRNLGVFLLHETGSQKVTRVEIYNLERKREYSGYPVYWLGRADNQESLNLLKAEIDNKPSNKMGEALTTAIGVHDDARVTAILKSLARDSDGKKIRHNAVFWLGHNGGETAFLADIARDSREDEELRKQAAFGIGISKDAEALSTLQNLYEAVSTIEVKKQIIFAMNQNDNEKQAHDLLLRIARTDSQRELRKQAIFWLGQGDKEAAVDDLMNLYPDERHTQTKKQVLFALSQHDSKRAKQKLVEVAKSNDGEEIRKQAIFWLGQSDDETSLDELMKIFEGSGDIEVKKQVLFAYSQHNSPRARARLLEAARASNDFEVRKQAIFWLGQGDDEANVDELMKLYEIDQNTEIRKQILFALSQMDNERATKKLHDVAKSDPEREVRKQAIFWIGQKHGETAVKALSELFESEKTYEVKEHIIFSLSQTDSKAGLKKLMEIAKSNSAYELRKKALFWLGQSDDPEAVKFLRDIIK